MTLTPPDLPDPARLQRTLRMPPEPGTTSPAVGRSAMNEANSPRSSSVQYSGHWRWNSSVSTTVSMAYYTPKAYRPQPAHSRGLTNGRDFPVPSYPHVRRPATSATIDRKSTRLNSSHLVISYAVFCL